MEREQKNHFLKIRIRSFAVCGVLTALILSAGCGTVKGGMTPVPGGASSNQSSRAVTAAPADEKERAEYSGTAVVSGEAASAIQAAAGKTSSDAVTAGETAAAAGKTSAETAAAGETAAAAGKTSAETAAAGETAAAAGETSTEAVRAGETAAAAGKTSAETAAAEVSAEAGTASRDKDRVYKAVVVIDPGHQGEGNPEQEPIGPGASETKAKVSSGTSGTASGVPEYQLTLEIGLKLRDELEDRGYRVIMARETNEVDISNSERAEIANEAGADAFVRIHANGSGNSGQTGAMTICQTPGNVFNGDLYQKSRALADCILDSYVLSTGIDYEMVWETDSMSGINWSQVPVTILEMGYMSNREEDLKMQDPEMQEKMVDGIADGIDAYIVQYPREDQENE